jgi:hypothetical protein
MRARVCVCVCVCEHTVEIHLTLFCRSADGPSRVGVVAYNVHGP